MKRRPMHMSDWIAKLDDFLSLGDRDLLTHAGAITHEDAAAKAEAEFEKYRQMEALAPQPVDRHFLQAMDALTEFEGKAKRKRGQR